MSHDSPVKKRKQAPRSDANPKKRKSVTFDSKPINVSISNPDSDVPYGVIVARTPGVEPPSNLSFSAYERRTRKKLLLHSATHPRLDFTAHSVPRKTFRGKDKHYVGVYDPKTGALQLHAAEAVSVKSSLKRVFEKTQANDEDEDEEGTEKAALSAYDQQVALQGAFGTKKAQKQLRSVARNRVSGPANGEGSAAATAISDVVLATAVESNSAVASSRDDLKALVDQAHPRPDPNLNAETPQEIYKLSSLVKRDDMKALDVLEWQTAVESGDEITTTSRFIGHRVIRIAEQACEQKLKALKYLYALILWLRALVIKGRDGAKMLPRREHLEAALPDIEASVRDGFRKRFAGGGARLSPWDVNKACMHACALALILDDCVTDTEDLQEDLKITSGEIKNYYRELGCKIVVNKEKPGSQIAKLTLPFKLPEIGFRRQRR